LKSRGKPELAESGNIGGGRDQLREVFLKIEYDGEEVWESEHHREEWGWSTGLRELRDTTLYERGLEIISGPSGPPSR